MSATNGYPFIRGIHETAGRSIRFCETETGSTRPGIRWCAFRLQVLLLALCLTPLLAAETIPAREGADSHLDSARRIIYRQCGLEAWQWVQPQPQGNHLRAVIGFRGQFVAAGRWGTLLSSRDGVSWRMCASGTHNSLNSLAGSAEGLVAVGNKGTVLMSRDGVQWSAVPPPTDRTLYYVIRAAGDFWAVGEAGLILRSADGWSWAVVDAGVSATLYGIAHGPAGWVIVGADGLILASADGTAWRHQIIDVEGRKDLYAVAMGTKETVVVGYGGLVVSSTDGELWHRHPPVVRQDLYAVHFAQGRFMAVGFGGTVLRRTQNGRWDELSPPTSAALSGITHADGCWQAVGYYGTILASDSGDEWRPPADDRPAELESVVAGPAGFVGVGRDGIWEGGADGCTWRQVVRLNRRLRAVQYDGRVLVAVGDSGQVWRSIDGRDWQPVETAITRNLYALATDGRAWVSAGEWGRIYHSDDGLSWTEAVSRTTQDLYAVTAGARGWVACGRQGTLLYSLDGRQWQRCEAGTTHHLYAVASGAAMYVAVGEGGVVTCSGDGYRWEGYGLGRRNHLEGICWSQGHWWAVGYEGIVFASLDGRTWLQLTSPTETGLYDIASDGRRLVAVGEGGVILTRSVPPPDGNHGVVYDTDPRLGPLRMLPAGRVPVLSDSEIHPGEPRAKTPGYRLLPRDLAVMDGWVRTQLSPEIASSFPAGYAFRPEPVTADDASPLRTGWREAVLYANQLSRARGLRPCYYSTMDPEERIHRHNYRQTGVFCDGTADGYRLPTVTELARLWQAMPADKSRSVQQPGMFGGEWCWPGRHGPAGEAGDGDSAAGMVPEAGDVPVPVVRSLGRRGLQRIAPPPGSRYPFRLVRTIQDIGPTLRINRFALTPGPEADIVVSAFDATGEALVGLRQDEVRVTLDGAEIPFNIQPLTGEPPVTGVICIDASASMAGLAPAAGSRLAREIFGHRAPGDHWSVLDLSTGRTLVGLTTDAERLESGLERLSTGGFTRLYDTLVRALEMVAPYPGSRPVVVLSDGQDTHSRHTLADVARLAADRRIPVYLIGPDLSPSPDMVRLARESGGGVFESVDAFLRSDPQTAFGRYPAGQFKIRGLATERLAEAKDLRLSICRADGLAEDSRMLPRGLAQWAPLNVTLPESVTIPPAGTVVLPVTLGAAWDGLPEAWAIASWELTLTFDAGVIRVQDLWPAGTLSEGWSVQGHPQPDGLVIRAEGVRPLRDRGILLNLQLAAAAAGQVGDCGPLALSAFRINGAELSGVTASARICLGEECVAGDVSGDGAVTVFDAQLIETFVAEGQSAQELLPCATDVTADGSITALDAAWIRRCDAGEWAVFPAGPEKAADSGARLRTASADLYNEREYVWRLPVVLAASGEVSAWEMVLEAPPDWSLDVERSRSTMDWSLQVTRRGNRWRVVMAGARPVTGGTVLFVEIRLAGGGGGRSWRDKPPDVTGLLRAYRIDEDPPVE